MKKTLFLLMALMMMGTAQTTFAQQRKAIAKKSATIANRSAVKRPAVKPAAPSIAWELPIAIDGHVAFLGIPLTETMESMRGKLIAKGLQDRREGDNDFLILRGVIDGTRVRVNTQKTFNGSLHINVYDEKTLPLAKAKVRFNELVKKLSNLYENKGSMPQNENDHKRFEMSIGGTKGKVSIEMFNEDEMDGASDYYQIVISFEDNK